VREMIRRTVEVLGEVDVLVNNAGIVLTGSGAQSDPSSGYDAMFRTNVVGALNCMLEVKDGMIARRHGKIVNVASIAGIGTAFKGTTLYASTKAAVISLTKRFAFELGEYSVNVNAVAPGFVETDQTRRGRTDEEFEPTRRDMSKRAALGRIGTPEDIGNAILFLSSEEASFITGQVLTVDGGRQDFLSHSA
jgi:3-oxoacyl-[acyl-carrier protein] reductase